MIAYRCQETNCHEIPIVNFTWLDQDKGKLTSDFCLACAEAKERQLNKPWGKGDFYIDLHIFPLTEEQQNSIFPPLPTRWATPKEDKDNQLDILIYYTWPDDPNFDRLLLMAKKKPRGVPAQKTIFERHATDSDLLSKWKTHEEKAWSVIFYASIMFTHFSYTLDDSYLPHVLWGFLNKLPKLRNEKELKEAIDFRLKFYPQWTDAILYLAYNWKRYSYLLY